MKVSAAIRNNAARRAVEAGFSLIEIMAVVVIIGLLAGLVGVAIFGQVDQGRQDTARAQIRTFEAALDLYKLDCHRYPTTEQGLKALIQEPGAQGCKRYKKDGYLSGGKIPLDPWENDYVYQSPGPNGERFWIASYGADQASGGDDADKDITNNDSSGDE